jgi:hypothetical protein
MRVCVCACVCVCVCVCVCRILNGLRNNVISLYSFKTVDKKGILRTVSNTGIYSSSDKVDTVYLVQCSFKHSTVNINAICRPREEMARCSSIQYAVCTITTRNWTHVHIQFLLRITDTTLYLNISISSWEICLLLITCVRNVTNLPSVLCYI